jgi:hypothetical protein
MKVKVILAAIFLIGFAACASKSARSAFTPDKAMLGQWQSEKYRCYISPDSIIWQDLATSDRAENKYKIEKVNDKERRVIFTYPEIPIARANTFTFTPSNNSFERLLDGDEKSTTFTFVDDKQKP